MTGHTSDSPYTTGSFLQSHNTNTEIQQINSRRFNLVRGRDIERELIYTHNYILALGSHMWKRVHSELAGENTAKTGSIM